jgi:chaperonin GroEL (HSP60 family)
VALVRAIQALEALKFEDDRRYGVNILRRSLEEPMRQIASNAGVEGSIVLEKVKAGKGAFGFNAASSSTRISSRPASSTRPRSSARRCRTRRRSPASC